MDLTITPGEVEALYRPLSDPEKKADMRMLNRTMPTATQMSTERGSAGPPCMP